MNMQHAVLLAALTGATSLFGATTDSFVRQTDLATGQVYDMPYTTPGGAYTAPLSVSNLGAKFELFARGTAWDTKVYLLDTKLVYAYAPAVAVTISTEDPYVSGDASSGTYVKRTRADRPFTVTTNISGLVTGNGASAAETSVYYTVAGMDYDAATYSALNQPSYTLHSYNLANGSLTWGPVYHELHSSLLVNGCGQQTYTFVRYAADQVPDTILAQPTLQVWPVTTATVANISAGQVLIDRIPSITVTLKHLYPDSRVYVQIYSGNAVLGKVGTLITGSERRYGAYYNAGQGAAATNVPQDTTITIDNLSSYASSGGVYTLEVISETPFLGRSGERLVSLSFEVSGPITTRGVFSSSEGP